MASADAKIDVRQRLWRLCQRGRMKKTAAAMASITALQTGTPK